MGVAMTDKQISNFSYRYAGERNREQALNRKAERIGCTPEELGRLMTSVAWDFVAPQCACGEVIRQKVAPGAKILVVCSDCAAKSFQREGIGS